MLEDEIYTPSSSAACGVYLELNKNYVVSGGVEFGKPFISLCGMIMPWESTTKRQRKGLRQLYKVGCQCQVSIIRKIKIIINAKKHIFLIKIKNLIIIIKKFSFSRGNSPEIVSENYYFDILIKVLLVIQKNNKYFSNK